MCGGQIIASNWCSSLSLLARSGCALVINFRAPNWIPTSKPTFMATLNYVPKECSTLVKFDKDVVLQAKLCGIKKVKLCQKSF